MTASEKEKILNFVYLNYEKVTDSKTGSLITELATALDLLELKEQNRIIELPFALGDFAYCIDPEFKIEGTTVNKRNALFILKWWGIRFFATKEEAEQRLEELRR